MVGVGPKPTAEKLKAVVSKWSLTCQQRTEHLLLKLASNNLIIDHAY
jgi:hypothetical protein